MSRDDEPTTRKCGTPELHQRLLQLREYQANQLLLEMYTNKFTRVAGSLRLVNSFDIPVVVHVVYQTDEQNVAEQQVQSQIEVLNRDYMAMNNDRGSVPPPWTSLVGSAGVQFHLASADPLGNPTDGITRTQTSRPSFGVDESVKSAATGGADPWPADRYLNIWTCNLAGGLLGYAQFPGGPATTDGVVIRYSAFGSGGSTDAPFDLGRTTTHEVGHWLNLRHIWGDVIGCGGDDYVDDTPPAESPNYGAPTFPHVTCNNGPNGDMFMNFMDYVDDDVMCFFTVGQVARMQAVFAGPRSSFATPPATARSGRFLNWVSTQSTQVPPQWLGWSAEFE
ncbi:MAG TPA: zinc metalloprotease [Thermoanaerobaculia bacterium]|nr:zinc metalloprotease [Thermoanaerobaculia bacterium]